MKTRKQKSGVINIVNGYSMDKIHGEEKRSKFIEGQNEILTDTELGMVSNSFKDISFETTNTNKQFLSIKKKKKFGRPVTIESDSYQTPSVLIPNVLRINNKSKATQIKNNSLSDMLRKTKGEESTASITIGVSIMPDIINSKEKKVELPKIGMNESMIMDEGSVTSVYLNGSSDNVNAGSLPKFYSLRNKVICVLEPQCKFSFHGKLKIEILYGGVNIYGAVVKKSKIVKTPIEVYSPRGNNLVGIQATTLENCMDNVSSIWNALKKDNVDCNISNALKSDINNVTKGWAMITLQNFENNLTRFLEANSHYKLFPKIEDISNYSWSDIKRAEIILQANIYCDNSTKPTINFSSTDGVVENILTKLRNNNNSRVIMAGGKNVGKSTTMRYLINKILETSEGVIVLDLDPGQAEFTPPGCISLNVVKIPLFGPNFTHLKKPYHQLYIGGIDVTRCLSNYINGMKKLVQFTNTYLDSMKLPVIVNTMGFCRGIGWDIITSIIKCVQPTDIIQIVSNRPKNNFNQPLTPESINRQIHTWTTWKNSPENNGTSSAVEYDLHIINTQAEIKSSLGETWNIEPHQQREIVMLAYLSEITNSQMLCDSDDNSTQININGVIPFQVPFSAVTLSLEICATPQVLSIMNGNIVALCGNDSHNRREDSIKGNSSSYPEVLIRLPLSTCYGFGIVRGVDTEKRKIYLNTPLTITELKCVNCLVGCMPVPSGLLQLNRFGVPYTGGSDCNLPTNRDPRRGYFRMKYRNGT